MIIVFDTETTGLTQSSLPPEHPQQPRLVQLGILLLTDKHETVASADLIVRPEGYQIPEAAARCHGITTDIALEVGIPLASVLSVFSQLRANAAEAVAFNLQFDKLVMEASFCQLGKPPSRGWPDKMTCCMEMATPIMDLPPTARMQAAGFLKNKPPNLVEAHRYFVGRDFKNAHSAMADARAALRVLLAIRERRAKGDTATGPGAAAPPSDGAGEDHDT